MDIELKPCPFCENTKLKIESKYHGHHYYEGTHSASVRCSKCHARGPTASCKVDKENLRYSYGADEVTKQKAAELWNAIPRETVIGSCDGHSADEAINRIGNLINNNYSSWVFEGRPIHCKECGFTPSYSLNKENSKFCPGCGKEMK